MYSRAFIYFQGCKFIGWIKFLWEFELLWRPGTWNEPHILYLRSLDTVKDLLTLKYTYWRRNHVISTRNAKHFPKCKWWGPWYLALYLGDLFLYNVQYIPQSSTDSVTNIKTRMIRMESRGTPRTRFYVTHCFLPGHPMLRAGHVHPWPYGTPRIRVYVNVSPWSCTTWPSHPMLSSRQSHHKPSEVPWSSHLIILVYQWMKSDYPNLNSSHP